MKSKDHQLIESAYEKIRSMVLPPKNNPEKLNGPIPPKTKANIEETLTHYYLGKLSLEDTLKYIKIQLETVKPFDRSDGEKTAASSFYK